MPTITVLPHPQCCPEGTKVPAEAGASICEALLAHGVALEHACEMRCACATCHVIVREGFATLAEPDDAEADLLDRAWGLEPESRLACQARVAQADLTVEIPKYSLNHAREEHHGVR